jgi:hypothetical protein
MARKVVRVASHNLTKEQRLREVLKEQAKVAAEIAAMGAFIAMVVLICILYNQTHGWPNV